MINENSEMFKIAVLVSGRGSNLQAIIDSIESKKVNAVIALVISDVRDAFALKRAEKHGVKTLFINPEDFQSRAEFDENIIEILNKEKVDLVCLAGFMRILSKKFVKHFKNRVMNIHPSLLPAFPGLNVQKKALDAGVKFSGCTVHFLDEGVDTGPVISQAAVPVLDNDTVESLSGRILTEEHRIYPLAIKAFIEKRLCCEGRKVFWKNEKT